MKLLWGQYALDDRREIYDYIDAENPRAAVKIDEAISYAMQRLLEFPMLGRTGRIETTRELVIAHTPYIVAYRIAGDDIYLLRILHGAQMWPEGFE